MVKYYSINNTFKCDEREKNNLGGKGKTKIIIPIIIIACDVSIVTCVRNKQILNFKRQAI